MYMYMVVGNDENQEHRSRNAAKSPLLLGTIFWSIVLGPELLKLLRQDFSTLLACQAGLLKTQLAHFQVITAGDEQNRRTLRMEFHLTCNVRAVEVSKPPSLLARCLLSVLGADEGNAEVALGTLVSRDILWLGGRESFGKRGRRQRSRLL